MKINKFGEQIYGEDDLCDLIMQGHDVLALRNVLVNNINLDSMTEILEPVPDFIQSDQIDNQNLSVEQYDHRCQQKWLMPEEYKHLDIAQHVLSLCDTPEQLQRAGQELLLFQERDLFNLLRYLKYLVDVMKANNVIWGVGRGSSVASYVLFLLGVHRIDSMYYDLDPAEFLR